MTSVANMNDGGGRTTEAVRQNWGWFLVLGIALVLCGAVAILLPLLSTYAASLVIGVAVAVGGVAHIIHAFRSKGWSGFFWDLLIGLIQVMRGKSWPPSAGPLARCPTATGG